MGKWFDKAPSGWVSDDDGWIWRSLRGSDRKAAPRDGFFEGGKVFCKFTEDAKAFDLPTPPTTDTE